MALLTSARGRGVLTALLVAACAPAHADHAAETDLKTAFVYNFIVLSTWPAEVPASLRFCVAGAPAAGTPFRVLNGKTAGSRSIAVTFAPTPERAAECQVLYVPPAESARLEAWLAAVIRQPTLTISDQAAPGAIVNLRLAGERMVFDVDTRAAAEARIGLSSQLIKLAAGRR